MTESGIFQGNLFIYEVIFINDKLPRSDDIRGQISKWSEMLLVILFMFSMKQETKE